MSVAIQVAQMGLRSGFSDEYVEEHLMPAGQCGGGSVVLWASFSSKGTLWTNMNFEIPEDFK